jgi:hypothetical protein
MHKMNPTLPTHAFVCNFRCNPWIMSPYRCLMRGRDVLISNVAMIEHYAMWRAHDHVVLSKLNWWMKWCVDLQCGHDKGVCNVTCSWSCSTKRIESTKEGMCDLYCGHDRIVYNMMCSYCCSTKRIEYTKEGMCWSPMWAWSRSMQGDVLMIM